MRRGHLAAGSDMYARIWSGANGSRAMDKSRPN